MVNAQQFCAAGQHSTQATRNRAPMHRPAPHASGSWTRGPLHGWLKPPSTLRGDRDDLLSYDALATPLLYRVP